jgi:hypothetical protein
MAQSMATDLSPITLIKIMINKLRKRQRLSSPDKDKIMHDTAWADVSPFATPSSPDGQTD